jgi:hypothetical protein
MCVCVCGPCNLLTSCDQVNEREYQEIVQQRREADDFIVDDGTGDYLVCPSLSLGLCVCI